VALFNDPVRGRISYAPKGFLIGDPVLVMGWDEVSGRFLICTADGSTFMFDIGNIELEWRWVPDRGRYPLATEWDQVAENWVQKTGPGWLDATDMIEVPE
jgi:hypothetical protein